MMPIRLQLWDTSLRKRLADRRVARSTNLSLAERTRAKRDAVHYRNKLVMLQVDLES
jgi:hypothetical protein